jgi:hypothetical protein
MHDQGNRTPSGDDRNHTPETTESTEAKRRELYDAVVAVLFQPTPEEVQRAAEDPESYSVLGYGPDAAGLTVFHAFGRWFAVWKDLEVTEGPPALRWRLLRIVPSPSTALPGPDSGPFGVEFYEV